MMRALSPWARLCICVIAAATLAGCASSPVERTSTPLAATAVAPATQFALSGRFSAKNSQDQVSGQLRYTQHGPERTLNLFSPLGTPLATIVASTGSATLTEANGNTQSAASLSALLKTVIDIPVTDEMLSAWLQGLPGSASVLAKAGAEIDARGLPLRFVENGWEILVSTRMAGADTRPFQAPQRMRWSLVGQPDTEVRWVIDEWSVP